MFPNILISAFLMQICAFATCPAMQFRRTVVLTYLKNPVFCLTQLLLSYGLWWFLCTDANSSSCNLSAQPDLVSRDHRIHLADFDGTVSTQTQIPRRHNQLPEYLTACSLEIQGRNPDDLFSHCTHFLIIVAKTVTITSSMSTSVFTKNKSQSTAFLVVSLSTYDEKFSSTDFRDVPEQFITAIWYSQQMFGKFKSSIRTRATNISSNYMIFSSCMQNNSSVLSSYLGDQQQTQISISALFFIPLIFI